MRALRTIRLVAQRDFNERVRSRAFQISTAFTLLLVLGAAIVPGFLDDDEGPPLELGVVGEAPPGFEERLEAALGPDSGVEITIYSHVAAAEAAVDDGDVDLALAPGEEVIVGEDATPSASLVAAVAAALDIEQGAADLGLDPARVAELLASSTYDIRGLEPTTDEEDASRGFAFVGIVLLFISIVSYGQWILIGVIEEKTNRVVEVILGAVKPHHLLAGKVAGIGTLGLGQLLVTAALGLAAVSVSGTITLPPATARVVVSVVVWFILGFAFYATAYAAAGALVSRQEDAQNVAFPLTLLLTGAYLVAASSLGGDNPVLRVAALLPPFAPTTMPLRMATGDANIFEVALSFVLMLAAIYGLIRVAGRVYSGGLLRTGGKVRLRDAWRSADAP